MEIIVAQENWIGWNKVGIGNQSVFFVFFIAKPHKWLLCLRSEHLWHAVYLLNTFKLNNV